MYLITTRSRLLSGLRCTGGKLKDQTYGETLDISVWPLLRTLGDEMFGARQPFADSQITTALRQQGLLPEDPKNPGQTLPYDGRERGEWYKSNDFFMRYAPQGEDGKNVEAEVSRT